MNIKLFQDKMLKHKRGYEARTDSWIYWFASQVGAYGFYIKIKG